MSTRSSVTSDDHTVTHVDRSGLDLGDFPNRLDGIRESRSGLRGQVAG